MATVEDIRINDQQTSGSTPIVIAGINPIFTWDFIQDAVSSSQAGYELRIGTSNSDLGTDSFYGNVYPSGWGVLKTQNSSSNTFEFEDRDSPTGGTKVNLVRGTIYYGQLRASDVYGVNTEWVTFAFQPNQLPFVTNYYLYPPYPSSADDIELVYTFNDPDDHLDSGSKIKWYKNGLPQNQHDDLCILPASATEAGETWTARLVPFDGLEYGATVETTAVLIEQIDVSFTEVQILPDSPNVDDILKVEYTLSEDEYNPIVGAVVFEWYINDVAVPNSNQTYIRLDLEPGDAVHVIAKITDGDVVLSEKISSPVTIADVDWYVYDLEISGLTEAGSLSDLSPVLEWQIHKTTADKDEVPGYFNVKVSTTPSISGAIYDSGALEYTKNSYVIPEGVLERGRRYFIHVAVSESSSFDDATYESEEVRMYGSSWNLEVDNAVGWTIEYKLSLESNGDEPDTANMGVYVHDGTYFCAITMGMKYVTLLSDTSVTYTYTDSSSSLLSPKTFRVAGKGQDVKVFMDNTLIIDATSFLTNRSNLKVIEYGDLDTKRNNTGVFRFFRYSTNGPYGFGLSLPDEDQLYFAAVGMLEGGSIESVFDDYISWLPDDETESAKLIQFNSNSRTVRLPTAVKNYSPITKIYIDSDRNKYIGTANGVTAIYGEKHDPDYTLEKTSDYLIIQAQDFDRITSVPKEYWYQVEENVFPGWFTIDTTYRALPYTEITGDEYNPYVTQQSHAVHYFTQRVPGHAWYDNVDNAKGWRVSFSFNLDNLEADDYEEFDLNKQGVGIYVNDGTYQEILYFYDDRVHLFYANVFAPIDTTEARDYVITGKGNNLNIYQKRRGTTTAYSLLVNGNGLFTVPSARTGNSTKPKIAIDHNGIYHTVWQDDGNRRSQIFYSSFDGSEWSMPELISQSVQFNFRNPDISIDSNNRIWVAYEDTSWGPTEIAVSVRDSYGWNPKTRITNYSSHKGHPVIQVDNSDNVHVVWEDDRNGHWEIFWAEWRDTDKAWVSSAQFGEDLCVSQYDSGDPYQSPSMDFRNPQLAVFDQTLWMVCEGHLSDQNYSAIFRSFRSLESMQWSSSGTPVVDENGEVIGVGISTLSSPEQRNCINPTISANEVAGYIVIAYEDETEPVRQIWGTVLNRDGVEIIAPEQITSQLTDCRNPSCGWVGDYCLILHERDNRIYMSYFNSDYQVFYGSNSGGYDRLIDTSDDKSVAHPHLPKYVPTGNFRLVYDFLKEKDPYLVSNAEFPEFYMIGDAYVSHAEESPGSETTVTAVLATDMISSEDIKEFAFGDFADNIGIRAHWAEFEMYFGYDSRPHSILQYNTSTVAKWPNDRVNDLFVDYYGNLITATSGGLLYLNIGTGDLVNIQGYTADYNPNSGCTTGTCLLSGKLTTTVLWGRNGIWYVGTTEGAYCSRSAGRYWEKLVESSLGSKVIYSMDIDSQGRAVIGTTDGVYVAHPDMSTPIYISLAAPPIKTVKVDESDIIWAGCDDGIYRIENFTNTNLLHFGRAEGMRSTHVNDISIVNKHLRYVATATGIERMHGTRFTNFNVRTHSLINDNIASLCWDSNTQSLWVGSLYRLYEIVFRDPVHDIIDDEVVYYDTSEISTESSYDRSIYTVLNSEEIQSDPQNPLVLTTESATVYVNKNKVDFGYIVGESGDKLYFLCNLLVDDQVEIETSNKFVKLHDFNQSSIEESVKGFLRSNITKMDRTRRDQLLLLSDLDKPSILLYGGDVALPFTTIMLDRDLPIGCFEQIATVSRNVLRFRILAYDKMSGLDGMILSNYENFTSDGSTPLAYQPFKSIVEHDIGAGLTNVIDSLEFPSTVTIGVDEYPVGSGAVVGTWFDESQNTQFLYAGTSSPAVIFRYDPRVDTWTAIQVIDPLDVNRSINEIKTIKNVIWVTTGSTSSGANGGIYKSTDGLNFVSVAGVTGEQARGIAGSEEGTVYFGSSDGKIYAYKDSVFSTKYIGIGQSIYSLTLFGDTLIAATGNNGRLYAINLQTDSNLIVFDGSEEYIRYVHVKDAESVTSPQEAMLFAASGNQTVVYRANLSDFGFVKSYSSFGQSIPKVSQVESIALVDPEDSENVTGTTIIAAIGKNLFKYNSTSWEFIYQHDEEINDFVQFFSNGVEGIWIASASKVTKWTAAHSTKTVYLRLKDKAGNISEQPLTGGDNTCPNETATVCCDYAYSINIQDLQNFVNESRIVDIDEYGEILFTYDSPNDRIFYAADKIGEEIGIYTSEVFNGSNELVAWKSITWEATEPTGTEVELQIRSSVSQDGVADAEWSTSLVKNSRGFVSLEHITDQYIQFRAILTSSVRDLSPTLTSVTLRNITAQSTHFFTTNFVLPSRPIKGLLTANMFVPISADIVFGINTKNTTDFGDYQLIEPNRLFTSAQGQFGSNLRIGAKLLSPGLTQLTPSNNPGDPYDATSEICSIAFSFTNDTAVTNNYHFRVQFYNDRYRTQLIYTFFSGNDQTGWDYGMGENIFPVEGVSLAPSESVSVNFFPGTQVESDQKWYITVDVYDGSSFTTLVDDESYICSSCNIEYSTGLIAQYYKTGLSDLAEIPDFKLYNPDYTLTEENIDFNQILTDWVTSTGMTLTGWKYNWAARWRGKLHAPASGDYTFSLSSDDGSKLFVDLEEIINHDGVHAFTNKQGSVYLSEGLHDIEIQFFQGYGYQGVKLYWLIPGESTEQIIPATQFYHAVASEYCEGTDLPRILNFAILFELENGETVKVNLGE